MRPEQRPLSTPTCPGEAKCPKSECRAAGCVQERNATTHEVVVTARIFSLLPWPTKTSTWTKENTCDEAQAFADDLRALGAVRVSVWHADRLLCVAPEVYE